MIQTGTILQERYLIEKQIGAGGMGAVYLATDQRFQSPVAIKETFYKHDQLGEAFEREAKLLNSLHHPNLPHVSDYFTEGGGHFLVMQFIEGEDLFEILKRGEMFAQADVLKWSNSLLDALDYLHSQEPPIIHRDIKPQNLKLTTRNDIILLDFGLAKLNSDDAQAQMSVFGYSRKYSPLEQIQGTGTDARSDIFALGATVYHLLTGKPPVDVLTRASAIVAGKPDPLQSANEINGEIPAEIASILNLALALNADARFESAKAIQRALEYALNPQSIESAEELPQKVLAIVSSENEVVTPAKSEHFPALDAFAAEAANNSQPSGNNDQTAAISTPNAEAFPTAQEYPQQPTIAVEKATKVSAPRPKKSRFSVAALAVLLACVGLAAGYFITRANSSDEPNQTAVTESTPLETENAAQPATVAEAPTPEVSDAPAIEKTEKTAPVKTETIAAKRETAAKREEPEAEPIVVETEKAKPARPTQKQPARPSQTGQNGETRTRVVEAPVPDIESIFTGQTADQREQRIRRQEQRRREREQMSDEELREYRRQRREARKRRGDGNNFPF